jgi:hypothetical protein
MNNQRILWFQDGTKLGIQQNNWDEIDKLTCQLIASVGHPEFEHVVVDPTQCLGALLKRVDLREFSVVVDLTGKLRRVVGDMGVVVEDRLHLSRFRVVSSPRLDGGGHLINLRPIELEDVKKNHNWVKPFVFDDVGWSGRTCIDVVRLLNLDFSKTTFGFLSLNVGNFGEGKLGASGLLKNTGAKVETGIIVATPEDDGFHLADFFQGENLDDEVVFNQIINLQKARENGHDSEVKRILFDNQKLLFPNAMTTEEMLILFKEGKVIAPGGINRNSMFDINPPNWLMPSFSKRIRASMIEKNAPLILSTLRDFKLITGQEGSVIKEGGRGGERI